MDSIATRLRQAVVAKEIYSPERSKLMLEAADKLDNLGNAAAIVYAAFKPVSGPDEAAKALLAMELGLYDRK